MSSCRLRDAKDQRRPELLLEVEGDDEGVRDKHHPVSRAALPKKNSGLGFALDKKDARPVCRSEEEGLDGPRQCLHLAAAQTVQHRGTAELCPTYQREGSSLGFSGLCIGGLIKYITPKIVVVERRPEIASGLGIAQQRSKGDLMNSLRAGRGE